MTMPLSPTFHAIAASLFHPGMGTEHIGPLLHAVACMQRPRTILAVGAGYSTVFLLQALADIEQERARDEAILAGRIDDPARRELLLPDAGPTDRDREPARLIVIDDFSDDRGRLRHLDRCIDQLGLASLVVVHRQRYQDWQAPTRFRADLVWLDCGHQLDYSDLCNRFWPLVSEEGGLLAMHYTYVDIQPLADEPPVLIAGPWINAAKSQHARLGPHATFELLSLVEPHKRRQGSVSWLRKSPADACRGSTLEHEQRALYGRSGPPLNALHGGPSRAQERRP
jgi:hypothetical protein